MYAVKTTLPNSITSIEQAKQYLRDLHQNGEAYHPDDPVIDCFPDLGEQDANHMEVLMNQVFEYFELANECPYQFLVDLNNAN